MSPKTTIYLSLLFVCFIFTSNTLDGQNKEKQNAPKSLGVSVSPSHFHFTQEQGQIKTYDITVKNTTSTAKSFNVNIYDFDMNGKGKSSFLPPGDGKYSLSKWMNISPTFIELEPFKTKKVKVTISVPSDDNGRKAAWSILMIEQEAPRNNLVNTKKDGNTVAFGIVPTFAFGIFAYQNPPNVLTNNIEFTEFQFLENDAVNKLLLEVQNKGDGIAYCTSYIDLTNLDTGEQQRLRVKNFTIVPDLTRDFIFNLPQTLQKGKYLAVGVLDYESSEEIQAAKLEFEIN
ncbi:hypothetical protein N9Q96_04245 [Flavobacteriaceae bacterium]|jgi:hypothetical protein|nr:hypothetical protein [Flavobacteriaceae bacterium]MDB4192505.1 hypothetical protein [Flavobacteriaceae bacterium]MDB9780979.1 hypothetical protein [Flavobacteriaceae bacterium]MDB9798443.1 hypothetical protein [Flavobacteriaceae bacterium]MDB9956352.1 hypothetical protein [Flavobacteriaceae bacterium]|tara:strand:- start:687 stop:1547 length:861 start_codon:yes stop_codon:yes gene_type:complete